MIVRDDAFSIAVIERPDLQWLGKSPVGWLQKLGQACWIDVPGVDNTRHRIITTLLHGNEPSGLLALHRWLRLQKTPAVNISFLVASVETALHEPLFSQRMLIGQRDLNRCFRAPFTDKQGRLAQAVIERINQLDPECVIDIHNTSGSGPSFSVSVSGQFEPRALARFFCRRMIVTDLRLGSLMEIDTGCAIVTIECGGAKDTESENTAFNGIEEITQAENLYETSVDDVEVMHNPIRVELNPQVTIAYSEQLLETVDITLWPDIEHCNHGVTSEDKCLGWVGPGGLRLLNAKNASGEDQLRKLLREENGWLYPACDLHLFMATTNATIARNDCLFYVVAADLNKQ